MAHCLKQDGHSVVTADNGETALAEALITSFDLVITDMQMPKMDGPALIEALRSHRLALPVIGMTGGLAAHEVECRRQH